ncbi:MAG: response regulator transcription factor [Bacteroidales bacterium]|jgi:DNA-binding NarL/FixJ family response regulator|nr:response regulator transcription factor [Bacteroidales bacterium]
MTSTFKIFISDPHVIFREGIRKIVSQSPELVFAGESGNTDLLNEDLKKVKPDLLIIYTIPFESAIGIAGSVKHEFPELKIALLTVSIKGPELFAAYNQGIDGIIHKAIDEKELMTALLQIKRGIPYYSQEILPYILKAHSGRSGNPGIEDADLTEKELSVLKYICKGYSNSGISELMKLRPRSVEGIKSRMIEKARVPNTLNLVLYALKNKIVSISEL